jgi:hypothetical protein
MAGPADEIPAGLLAGQPLREFARAQDQRTMSTAAKEGTFVAVTVLVPAILTIATGVPLFFLLFAPFYFGALVATGAQILFSPKQ